MIQHVAIEVREQDVEACVGFWALLGFRRVPAPPTLAARSAWVQAGGTQVHLLFSEQPVVAPAGHVAVVVADYDATLAALREAGFEAEERARHWGSPRAFVHTPTGHLVELMAFSPV